MARQRMVTRNVAVVTFDVMAVNMATLKVENISVDVPSADSMNAKALEKCLIDLLPEGYKYVTHTADGRKEVLYGMPEVDFIRLAKVLPPRTKADAVEE